MHGGRPYQVYFDRFTAAQWKEKEADYAAELARQRALAARTVDLVVPDREQSERDHKLNGERTAGGDFGDHKWRHATEGGWFSWQLKVLPDQPQELWVTYWGSDVGNRVFDVLVDGQKITTQRLANNKPDKFYDVVYPLPADLLRGKQSDHSQIPGACQRLGWRCVRRARHEGRSRQMNDARRRHPAWL